MSKRLQKKETYTVGVLSDTHGLLRPEVYDLFQDVDSIIHAGDIDRPSTLEELHSIAPVIAVRGNMDDYSWAHGLAETEAVEIGSIMLYVLHDINRLDLEPSAAGFRIVVSGHSHRPSIREQRGVLYLNPGSAGPKRFRNPVSVAFLNIKGNSAHARIVELKKITISNLKKNYYDP
ncbi:metallophosphoesterase [bacterium]|nr:MAG: metallophosphoesterase [bacterium]